MNARYRIKHMFISMLASYALLLVLPCVFIVQMYLQSLQMAEQVSVDASLVVLRQAQVSMDEKLEIMDKAARRIVIDYGAKSVMKYEKPKPGYPLVYQILQFSKKLSDMLSVASEDLAGYRLFFRDNELIFYEEAVTVGLEFYFNSSLTYSGMTFEQWYGMMFAPVQNTLYPSATIRTARGTMRAMTYVYPLTTANGMESGGAVQFLIPDSFLENIVNTAEGSGGSFYLLDAEGRPLCVIGGAEAARQVPASLEFAGAEGYLHYESEAGRDILSYVKSPHSGLVFVSRTPESVVMEKAIHIRRTAQWGIFILVLAEIVIGLLLARRNATPIMNFVRNLRSLLTDDPGKKNRVNEYEYLRESLPKLQKMHSAMQEKILLERRHFLSGLFEGRLKDASLIRAEGHKHGISLEAESYCVVSFHTGEQTQQAQRLLESGARAAAHPVLFYHDHEPDMVSAVCAFDHQPDEDAARRLRDSAERMVEQLRAEGISCRAGMGLAYADCADLCFSYNQSRYCAMRDGGDPVTGYAHIPKAAGRFHYPTALEQKLLNAARHREPAQVDQVFDELSRENLEKRTLLRAMADMLIASLEATLVKACDDIVYEESEIEDALIRISKQATPEAALAALRAEFQRLACREEEQASARHVTFRQNVEASLQKHYQNPDLGVALMAGEFDLSESYFSQLFKDVMGETFSAYLENLRLVKASRLIVESDMEIEQIANQVGYANSTTFRRAFKRVYSQSPTAFKRTVRQAMQSGDQREAGSGGRDGAE